ncbi:FKBP-like protein [Ascodesmis nigricans]|uniref:Peptidyl-prolyl cis-trans isomerase n=1 Tax=Ascodesmis nigricans TaxID=341454 RepID=A0A4S2MPJ7_9PEZI|nr:FKBP-like protein [Ascodesmis nigricans]
MGKKTDSKKTDSKKTDSKKTDTTEKKSSGGKGNNKGELKPATSINVRHILCEKHSDIVAAQARIDAGESFDKVAREVSQDKARQGGSLGWQIRGAMVKEFETAAFALQTSKPEKPIYAGPVKTGFGYHLIMVEGRK